MSDKPKPPPGYSSWLDYAVSAMSTRHLHPDSIDDTKENHLWGRIVQRGEMRQAARDELDALRARLAKAEEEGDRLKSFIAQSVPFLEEAWTACFRGQEERLLSAEERGMGELMGRFKEVAEGKPCLPPGVITTKEAATRENAAREWTHLIRAIAAWEKAK